MYSITTHISLLSHLFHRPQIKLIPDLLVKDLDLISRECPTS